MSDFFAGKRCLVTGAAGFIGSKLVAALKARGATAGTFDRSGDPPLDVCSRESVEWAVGAHRPQVVFHLAAMTEVGASFKDPFLTSRVNIVGTLNVLECCRQCPGLLALVVASSDKAYGNKPASSLPLREEMPLASEGDPYSCSKRVADLLAHDWARNFGMPVRVLRCANVYGPGQKNSTTLITSSILKALAGQRPTIHAGQATTQREWLYVDDAVEAYLLAAEDAAALPGGFYEGLGSHAFNVGSGEVRAVGEVVEEVLWHFDRPKDFVEVGGGPCASIGDQRLDSSRFRKRFPEWRPLPFAEGLARTIIWHLEQADHEALPPRESAFRSALAKSNG